MRTGQFFSVALVAPLAFAFGLVYASHDKSSEPQAPTSSTSNYPSLPALDKSAKSAFGQSLAGVDAAGKGSFGVASPLDTRGVRRLTTVDGLQAVTIIDSMGFGQPTTAGTVRIPVDWRTRGGVTWDRSGQCVTNMLRMNWAAFSPDGLQGFEIRPGYTWQVQGTEIQMNPCAPMPISSVREYLSMVVNQRYGNNARILDYRDRPDLAQSATPGGSNPGNTRLRVEAGQMLIAFAVNGKEFRESLTTVVNFTEQQGNVIGGTSYIYAQHAPNGSLDMDLGERLRASFRLNAQWNQMAIQIGTREVDRIAAEQSRGITRWHNDRMAAINLKGANDRSQIRMQTNREISQIYSETWKNTQDTNDRNHRRSLEAVGEYNTFRDPGSSAPVRATIHDNHVWRVGDGKYISTNDPNFSPANGVQLRRLP